MKNHLVALALVVALLGGTFYIGHRPTKSVITPKVPAKSHEVVKPAAAPAFDKSRLSVDHPTSLWVVVNKRRPLQPTTFMPVDLTVPKIPLRAGIGADERQVRTEVATALEAMAAAAATQGITLNLQSGYRSYNLQVSVYNGYVQRDGQAAADTYSARPGYSEHQTGLAADLGGTSNPACNVATCFADTPEGQWLAIHAYEYGFIIRYQAAKQSITGYEGEAWHVRYIGKDLASEMHSQNSLTLEEFFNLPPAPSY